MALRPPDYGDKNPSDQDDTVPGSPVTGYSEMDSEIQSAEGKPRTPATRNQIAPDPGVDPIAPTPPRTWFALILEEVDPSEPEYLTAIPELQQWWVLRQDGKRVAAYVVYNGHYEEYRPGYDVIIRKDQANDDGITNWIIIGKMRPQELPVVDAAKTVNSGYFTGPFFVVFNSTQLEIPIDDTFGGYEEVIHNTFDSSQIGVFHGVGEALYHIEFTVNIQCGNATEMDQIWTQAGCWQPSTLIGNGFPIKTPKIWFHSQNGFRVQYDPSDCTVGVSLGSTVSDSVLNQRSTWPNNTPHWTDSPYFGGNVTVGSKGGTKWVKIGTPSVFAWLTHGNGRLKFRFPPSAPAVTPSFLMGTASNGLCVQTNWMPAGGQGTISARGCNHSGYTYCYITVDEEDQYCAIPTYPCQTWKVCNGLIVSGPGITSNPFGTPCETAGQDLGTCPDGTEFIDDPCGYVN